MPIHASEVRPRQGVLLRDGPFALSFVDCWILIHGPAKPVCSFNHGLVGLSLISTATIAALVFTVALLVTTAYFLMGGLPLLILKHDTPVDARFVRRFFEIYYAAAIVTSSGATLSYALAGHLAFALGTLAILTFALLLRRRVAAAMARVGEQIQQDPSSAVSQFRRIHSAALAANAVQLIALLWGISRISV